MTPFNARSPSVLLVPAALMYVAGCSRQGETVVAPGEERAVLAARLRVAPDRMVYVSSNRPHGNSRYWRILSKGQPRRAVAFVQSYGGRLAQYASDPTGDLLATDPLHTPRPGMTQQVATTIALELAGRFWPLPPDRHTRFVIRQVHTFVPPNRLREGRTGQVISVELGPDHEVDLVPPVATFLFDVGPGVCCGIRTGFPL